MKNMLGLVVTREEFEHQLARSAQMGLEEEPEPEESAQIGGGAGGDRPCGWGARAGRISRCCVCSSAAAWMRSSRTA